MHSPAHQITHRILLALLCAVILAASNPAVAAEETETPAAPALKSHATVVSDANSPRSIQDPWEDFNRSMYRFNKKADKYVLRPLAVAYDTVTPAPVQRGITNFFANLLAPRTAVNQLLQGRPDEAAQTLERFATNSTIGVAGVLDPASSMGLEAREEDFGRTLAHWGWQDSRYLVLPLTGPGTIRDLAGNTVDGPLAPLSHVDNGTVVATLGVVDLANSRTQVFPLEPSLAAAPDEYAVVRDMWMQRRNQKTQAAQPPRKD